MTTLTQSLGDKLVEAGVTEDTHHEPRRRPNGGRRQGNPRSGVDFPVTLLALPQKSQESGDKNDEEVGTASEYTNNKNNRTETHMNTTSTTIESNENVHTNGAGNNFDNRALGIAERATAVGEKIANDGIKVRPEFKRRSAAGNAVLGAVVGGTVVAAAAGTAMALIPAQRTNEDIINAAATGFSAGAMIGAGVGFWLSGEPEPKTEAK